MNAFLLQSHVLAQNIRNPAIGPLADLTGPEFLGRLIPALVSLGLVIGAIVFLFFFLTGGISWISSGGDKMKIEHARSKITTALIGLVILLSFMAIIGFVECFFGIGLREVSVGPFQINFSNVPMCGGGGSPGPPVPPPSCTLHGELRPDTGCGTNCKTCEIGGDVYCWNLHNDCPLP